MVMINTHLSINDKKEKKMEKNEKNLKKIFYRKTIKIFTRQTLDKH
jgi:hypothetical protein